MRQNINTESLPDEFPWSREKETWEHAVQCRNTVNMRVEFILELHEDLKKL